MSAVLGAEKEEVAGLELDEPGPLLDRDECREVGEYDREYDYELKRFTNDHCSRPPDDAVCFKHSLQAYSIRLGPFVKHRG